MFQFTAYIGSAPLTHNYFSGLRSLSSFNSSSTPLTCSFPSSHVYHFFLSEDLRKRSRPFLSKNTFSFSSTSTSTSSVSSSSLTTVCAQHSEIGMAKELVTSSDRLVDFPWTESIAGPEFPLLFMPFIHYQMEFMKQHIAQVQDLEFDKELSLQLSSKKAAKIESWCFKSPQFRKIRSTYIDAGIAAQVFNSVWYPEVAYDIPLLGIDFLAFGKKKILVVLDFQPLSQDPQYLEKYTDVLGSIKTKYPSLCGQMSQRFYDENKFFSKHVAFGRLEDSTLVMNELFPAFKECLEAYLQLMREASPATDPSVVEKQRELHKEYDQYSAERDPAVGLFSTYFGEEWAEAFTHEFLFSDSVPIKK